MQTNGHFGDRLVEAVQTKRSILCCGLDPQLRYMPLSLIEWGKRAYGTSFEAVGQIFTRFNREIIDSIAPYAPVVKPQMAFYEAYGSPGIKAFEDTVSYAKEHALIVTTDAKRGDGSDTADAYADGHIGEVPFFDHPGMPSSVKGPLRVDAVTVSPPIGDDCVTRFVQRVKNHGTGIFVVDKTSFKPNSRVEQLETKSGLCVWQELAGMVHEWGAGTEGESGYRSVGVVLGATYPEDAPWMRKRLPNSWFLVPGYGGQGGTAKEAVVAVNTGGLGCIVNSSRGIIYAYRSEKYRCASEDYAMAAANAARDARDELMQAIKAR